MTRKSSLCLLLLAVLFLAGCAATPMPHPEQVSNAPLAPLHEPVWDDFRASLPTAAHGDSWFGSLDNGREALLARIALVDSAREVLDLQYFLWLEDKVGSLLFERLLVAAQRGVRIRLLLDDSFTAGEDSLMLALAAHPNIEVRIYNPFAARSESMVGRYLDNLHDLSRTNHRMHNKLMVADGAVAILGGRNIADEYFGFGEEINFRDFDLLMSGPVVPELSDSFDLFWNSGWAFPVPEVDGAQPPAAGYRKLEQVLRQRAAPLDGWLEEQGAGQGRAWSGYWREQAAGMIPGRAELLLDAPHFERLLPTQLAERLLELLEEVEEDLYAVSAYLIMTDGLLETTRRLVEKGVRVRFLTNSLASTNHVPAHSAYRRHRRQLLESGAELHVLREAFAPALLPSNSWRLVLNEAGRIEWHSSDGVLTRQPAAGPGQRLLDFFIGMFPLEAQL